MAKSKLFIAIVASLFIHNANAELRAGDKITQENLHQVPASVRAKVQEALQRAEVQNQQAVIAQAAPAQIDTSNHPWKSLAVDQNLQGQLLDDIQAWVSEHDADNLTFRQYRQLQGLLGHLGFTLREKFEVYGDALDIALFDLAVSNQFPKLKGLIETDMFLLETIASQRSEKGAELLLSVYNNMEVFSALSTPNNRFTADSFEKRKKRVVRLMGVNGSQSLESILIDLVAANNSYTEVARIALNDLQGWQEQQAAANASE